MAINETIPANTSDLPDIKTQTQEAFSTNADAAFLHIQQLVPSINTWAGEANSTATQVNTDLVNATTKASEASTSATNASNSATASANSATASATSATAAQTALDTFTGQYHGALSTAPTTGVDTGDLYFDTTANEMRVYDGGRWISAGSATNGTSQRQSFTATSGQTTFTVAGGYDANFADVYLNGVKLVNGVDVNVTSGVNVVLTVGATAGDTVDVVAYGAFEIADTYTQAEIDNLLVMAEETEILISPQV
jgi:uncharacterized circularly permuted ATP-grasp superfamily protein